MLCFHIFNCDESIYFYRICVDIIKKHHLFSNVSKRHLRNIHNHSKLGIFRFRNQQLMDLGVSVCNINQGHYERLSEKDRIDYLRELIFDNCTKYSYNIARQL